MRVRRRLQQAMRITGEHVDVPGELRAELDVMSRPRPMVAQVPDLEGHASIPRQRLPERHLVLNGMRGENDQHEGLDSVAGLDEPGFWEDPTSATRLAHLSP